MNEMTIENVNSIIYDAKKGNMRNLSYDEFYDYFSKDYTDEEIDIAYKRVKEGRSEIGKNSNVNYFSYHGLNIPANKLTRSLAKEICFINGVRVSSCYNLAKENSGAYTYWLNPDVSCINEDWTIILNDYKIKTLHVFSISAYTLSFKDLKTRADKPSQFDIQINVKSASYQDIRSKIKFGMYHVADVTY